MTTLVDELETLIGRFVVMSDDERILSALWVVHTYCLDAFEQTPYLAITSPEKQCGKSRLLEVLELLVAKPWMTILPSEAVTYRKIAGDQPTLLLDEVDTIFNPKTADKYEALRALLNAGHRRGAVVPRCLGTNVAEFAVFCPKVLAGIGTLPDTVADRSLPIRLKRRTRGEEIERFLRREVEPVAEDLRTRIALWGAENGERLQGIVPEVPEQLSDRMQESSEALLVIADDLGHGVRTREALVNVLTTERLDSTETWRIRLLGDLREVYDSEKYAAHKHVFTADIISALHLMEERGWRSYYGRGLQAEDLASLLRHYDIHSAQVRVKDKTAKGYRRDDLHELGWSRYLSHNGKGA